MPGMFEKWDERVNGRTARPVNIPESESSDVDPFASTAGRNRAESYARAALDSACRELAGVPIGTGRNDALNRAALRCYRLHLGAGLPLDNVTTALGAADGGLDYPATARTLQSAREAAEREGPAMPPDDTASGADNSAGASPGAPGRPAGDVSPMGDAAIPARVDWHALWAEPAGDDWILEPLIPARRLVAIYSAPKVGKSLLMLDVAVGIAQGRRTLGAMPDKARRVLYVDHENDPRGDVRARLDAMGHGPDDLDNLIYLSFPTMAALDSERGGQELLAAALHYNVDVVIIDTASRTVAGKENENDTWLGWYRHTGAVLKRHGVTVVRLDHAGKDADKGMRGGSAKAGDVDAIWRLDKITERAEGVPETLRLQLDAARLRIAENDLTIERRDTPRLHHVVLPGARRSAFDAKVAAIIATADHAGLPADAGRPAIREACRAANISAGTKAYEEAARRRHAALGAGGQRSLADCPDPFEGSVGQQAA